MVLREYSFIESLVFGAGVGFTLALLIGVAHNGRDSRGAGVCRRTRASSRGAITLITAGILALSFMAFGGMFSP